MSLFQNSVLNKYLSILDEQQVEAAWNKFTAHFHDPDIQENIRNAKEEQYQGEFLIDLFVNVFGYVKNPASGYNLTTELKNIKDSKKADGAILQDDKAIAVIELKGTNTVDLGKVETQAFGYKSNQPGCIYVITSNFEKLRFYIDNAVDFEEFNLFELSRQQFDILYLCLAAEYLLKGIPKQVKDESLTQEENVTKKLYKDYSLFRTEIFNNIQKKNSQYDKLTLFKKTQKLLDRFLFIFFAEDRLLLPPNSIREIVNQWTDLRDKYDEYFPLYDRFKKYFGYMNSGYAGKKHDIFAYNGGLFEPDEILDNIAIEDELLHKHTLNLSNYDFESEVSVNILGHIFEHSLTEIENIQAQLEGVAVEKSKTKRKKDGVFYTPKYITKYIVDNTVGKLCEEKKTELDIQEADYEKERKGRKKATLQGLQDKLDAYRNWLLELTICDPACGSGAFLNQALEFLIAEHNYINELEAKLYNAPLVLSRVENAILENNLFGVDINEESVEIAKLSLWLRTAQKGRKLTTLSDNIKCGNSLIDDSEVAGDKAFDWIKEFPDVFAKGGFDVVIGNPPWGAKMGELEWKFIKENHKDIIVRMVDSFMFFIDKSYTILNDFGCWGLIVPDVLLYQKDNEKLRKKILAKSNLRFVINVGDGIFENVARPSAIAIASLGLSEKGVAVGNFNIKGNQDLFSIPLENIDQKLFETLPNTLFATKGIMGYSLLKRLSINKLKTIIDEDGIQRGVSPDLKDAFIVSEKVIENKNLESAKIHRTVTGGVDVKQYAIHNSGKNILYVSKNDLPEDIPNIVAHISEYRDRITCSEVRQGKHPFYVLHRARNEKIFTKKEKILGVITGDRIITAVDSEGIYPTDGLYLFSANLDVFQNKALSAILNTKLITYLYRLISSETNRTMAQVKPVLVSELPIVVPSVADQSLLTDYYKEISISSSSLLGITQGFASYCKKSLNVSLNKKLHSWHELEFADFIKELNKTIKNSGGNKLTKSDEIEWMELFEAKRAEAQKIKSEIEKTANGIDRMVYELYGLTEDEIKLVEES